MGTPTKEQWAEIAERLDQLFGNVYLRCDGYLVHAALGRIGKNRLAIIVYVNGMISGAWVSGKEVAEEARRFWCRRSKSLLPAKRVRAVERDIGKRVAKKYGLRDKFVYYEPFWSRPLPLIRHLRKHNQDIEILDYRTYAAELEAHKAQEASHAA